MHVPIQPPLSHFDAEWYIPRSIEETLVLDCLKSPGSPATIWGPLRSGKTWLLRAIKERLVEHDPKISLVEMDFRRLSETIAQSGLCLAEVFCSQFLIQICESLGLDFKQKCQESQWDANNQILSTQRLLDNLILTDFAKRNQCLYIFIDNAHELPDKAFRNIFFSSLRSWLEYHIMATTGWRCLRIAFTISTHPSTVIDTRYGSPFNIGRQVELKDLDEEQVFFMGHRHQLALRHGDFAVLKQWVGGHAYLVRQSIYTAKRYGISLQELFDDERALHSDLVQHLEYVQHKLSQQPALHQGWSAVLANGGRTLDQATAHVLQHELGLISPSDHQAYSLRHQIYYHLFKGTVPESALLGSQKNKIRNKIKEEFLGNKLDSLIIDYFGRVAEIYSNSMESTQKINLIFTHYNLSDIEKALEEAVGKI